MRPGKSRTRFKSANIAISITIPRSPRIEKTVKPYDARWNWAFSRSLSVASPTCIAVSKAAKTTADATQVMLSRK